MMMQLGPGMYSQRTGPCDECDGKGESIDPAKKCKTCNGKKIQKDKKKLKVEIDKGAPNGEKYVIHGEGDQIPDAEPGDVVIQVRERPHKLFKRKGADLFMEKEISLIEALTGLEFLLTHLDGRKIRIQNKAGDVIKPEDYKTVEGLGMPLNKRSYQFGNLVIHFKIKFPASMDTKHIALVQEALSNTGSSSGKNSTKNKGTEEAKNQPVDETVELKQFEEHHRNTHHGGGTHGNESEEDEDDEGSAGPKVGCQSQ